MDDSFHFRHSGHVRYFVLLAERVGRLLAALLFEIPTMSGTNREDSEQVLNHPIKLKPHTYVWGLEFNGGGPWTIFEPVFKIPRGIPGCQCKPHGVRLS